jgi:hypothetical protein
MEQQKLRRYQTDSVDHEMKEFKGKDIKLTFDEELFMRRPTINKPFIPIIYELRLGIVWYCHNNWPELLEYG